jgi:hypothetical protein
MMSVTELKHAIKKLPEQKRRALARWLSEQESKAWDEQMADDSASGRLQFLIDEANSARSGGKLKKFP